MDFKELLGKKETLTYWADFDDDLSFLVEYVDKKTNERMLEQSKKRGYDKKTHLPNEELDSQMYCKNLAEKIKDWKGLTIGKLAELVNIDIADEDSEKELPFTPDNAILLVQEAYGIDIFLSDITSNLQVFREGRHDFLSETSKPMPE